MKGTMVTLPLMVLVLLQVLLPLLLARRWTPAGRSLLKRCHRHRQVQRKAGRRLGRSRRRAERGEREERDG